MVDITAEPELSRAEALAALLSSRRFGDRAAAAEYGDTIAVHGRLYRCVWAGDTAETLPASLGRTQLGRWTTDGSAQWEDIGPRPSSEWDFTTAKWRLYDLRVQRTAEMVNEKDKDYSQDIEALHRHWVAERAKVVSLRAC